tara:strand:+ start:2222 stop:2581 length:360 start_codon:yes stop_codon:yes gene_type:complete
MLYIIIIFFIVIVLIELYSIIRIYDYLPVIKENMVDKTVPNNDIINFTKYSTKESFSKKFKKGYLYTDVDENIFVITDVDVVHLKKNKIFKINSDFTLEFININNNIVNYYYNAENNKS